MRGVRFGILTSAIVALTALLAPHAQAADAYPTRPIQVIVPFAGGSASDVVTRILLNRMSQELKQNFVVENRPGAGGNTGTAAAIRATADGYTLVMSTSGPLAANRTLFKDLGYDPEKELTPISLFATLPNIIVINSKLPPKTLTDFVQYAKEHPGMNYGSVGVGSSQHLAGAYFEQITGVKLTHVPYRNIANYTPDFIAGQVPLGFQFLPNVLGMIKSGDARPLAVTTPTRMSALPDVPTAAEAGVKGYQTFGWLALLGPAGMPKEAVDKIYGALKAAVNDPTIKAKCSDQGIIQKAGIEPM
jgi:tripartite-type tricarboxylate transporter receptor subunit TctC